MNITVFRPSDVPQAVALWEAHRNAGTILYKPMDMAKFEKTFLKNEHYSEEYMLAAREDDGTLLGFASALVKRRYLQGETYENTPAYLTMVMVDPACLRKGIATALLDALEMRFAAAGKTAIAVTYRNPVPLGWQVPCTPGHDHNNAPGIDTKSAAYQLLLGRGYALQGVEYGMYLNLAKYASTTEFTSKKDRLAAEGVHIEFYDPARHHGFDELFDAVHGEVWRATIAENNSRQNPLPVLVAVHGGKIVGFAGPIDREESGRGWFNGIATHPAYGRRGIAMVLFHSLMQQFVEIGAAFSTLFTDDKNPASRLYEAVGFEVAREWAVLKKEI